MVSPIYTRDQREQLERDAITYGALSRIAQELALILSVPSPDVPGDLIAELQRLHKDACDDLERARAIGSGP